MSRILRRPMFRGGPVSSYGTGITSGLANGGMPAKRGLVNGPGGYSGQRWNPAWLNKADDRGYRIGSDLIKQPTSLEELQNSFKGGNYANRNILNQIVEKEVGSEGDVIESTTGEIFYEEQDKAAKKQKKADDLGITVVEMDAIDRENLSTEGLKDIEKEKMIAGIYKEPEGPVNNNGKIIPPPAESYEINADDVRAQAALFDELLNEGYEKDKRSAQISDASDYALQFFKSTVGEGKGIKEAAGDVAGRALATPSRTEKVQEGKKKTKQTATVMAINEAIAQGKSARDIDMLIAKSGLDLENKKKLVDYGQTLTKGFNALAGHVADSKSIGFVGRLKDGLSKAGLIGYPTETVTSVDMADETKFKFDPKTDVGKIFIETDTETAYVFDKNGKKTRVA